MSEDRFSRLKAFATRSLTRQATVYGAVSALALGLDVGVFILLTRWGLMASIAAVIGYMAGLVAHFLLSVRLVFDTDGTDRSGAILFARFAASGLAGLAITATIVALVADLAGFAPILAKTVAVVTSFLAVFLLRRTIVFARAPFPSALRGSTTVAAGERPPRLAECAWDRLPLDRAVASEASDEAAARRHG